MHCMDLMYSKRPRRAFFHLGVNLVDLIIPVLLINDVRFDALMKDAEMHSFER